jgi:hypothetical protein
VGIFVANVDCKQHLYKLLFVIHTLFGYYNYYLCNYNNVIFIAVIKTYFLL